MKRNLLVLGLLFTSTLALSQMPPPPVDNSDECMDGGFIPGTKKTPCAEALLEIDSNENLIGGPDEVWADELEVEGYF